MTTSRSDGPHGADLSRADGAESTLDLVQRARAGSRVARDVLIARYLPRLQRWARGRLPTALRDMADTADVVQEAVFQTFRRIEQFEPQGPGALQQYLRLAVMNRIRDEVRRAGRRPPGAGLDRALADPGPSPLETAIGADTVARYEHALERLRPEDREAVIARVELGLNHGELAEALGKPTPNAARMAAERALVRLAREMASLERARRDIAEP